MTVAKKRGRVLRRITRPPTESALAMHVGELWSVAGFERLKGAVARELRGSTWQPDAERAIASIDAATPRASTDADAMREHAKALRDHAKALRETPPLVAALPLPTKAANAASPLAPSPVVYTSNRRGPNLPGKSRQWTVRNMKRMPGAHRVGRDWQISAADFQAFLQAEDARHCAAATKPASSADARDVALKGLATIGYRPTKGVRDA